METHGQTSIRLVSIVIPSFKPPLQIVDPERRYNEWNRCQPGAHSDSPK